MRHCVTWAACCRCMFRMKQPLAEHFQRLCSGEIKAEPPMPPEQVQSQSTVNGMQI